MNPAAEGRFRTWLRTRTLFADTEPTRWSWGICAAVTVLLVPAVWLLMGPSAGWHRVPAVIFALAVPLLIWVDLREHRLPDLVVLPLLAFVFAGSVWAAIADDAGNRLVQALAGAVLLTVVFGVLFVLAPASLGFGDVKLAAVIGVLIGWYGWRMVIAALVLTLCVGVVHGLLVAVVLRRVKNVHIAFGPAMLVAALMTCVGAAALT